METINFIAHGNTYKATQQVSSKVWFIETDNGSSPIHVGTVTVGEGEFIEAKLAEFAEYSHHIIVTVLESDLETETVTVKVEETGAMATVNLWEVYGYVRVEDGHTAWKYLETGE